MNYISLQAIQKVNMQLKQMVGYIDRLDGGWPEWFPDYGMTLTIYRRVPL